MRTLQTKVGVATMRIALAAGTILSAGAPALVHAQAAATAAADQAETGDIVVTATRMGETSLQRTALAITALGGDTLGRSNIRDVRDIGQVVPGVEAPNIQSRATIYIRGVGTNLTNAGSDPSVALQVDGVYLARPYEQFTDFFDVERVEILKGPQGTLYGRNSSGGVINVISRRPTDDLTGMAQVTVGTYKTFQGQGYVSGPLVQDKLSASIAVNYYRHDGYLDNVVPGGKDSFNANRGGVRTQLRWTPSDRIDAITRFDYSKARERIQANNHLLAPLVLPFTQRSIPLAATFSAPLANSIVGNFEKVSIGSPQYTKRTSWGVSEDVSFKLSDDLTLKSLTAYRYGKEYFVGDVDGTEILAQTTSNDEVSKQFSQEFNLSGGFGPLSFVGGLYYFHESDDAVLTSISYPGPARTPAQAAFAEPHPNTTATSKAVFGNATFEIVQGFKATLGARYTWDKKRLDTVFNRYGYANPPALGPQAAGFPFVADVSRKFHAFTPKVGLEWTPIDPVFLYANYSKGFKSGGFNYAATSLIGISYSPETVKSYEAGIKTTWLNRRLIMNATAFKYDYTNLQVQATVAPGVTSINNAASASIKGLELEFRAKPIPQFELSANASYLKARYDTYLAAAVPNSVFPFVNTDPRYSSATNSFNASNNYLNAAPKFAYNIAGQYTVPVSFGDIFGRAEWYHRTRTYYDPSNALIFSQPSYGILNLAVGFTSSDDKWLIQLRGENVLNEHYLVSFAGNGPVPAGNSGAPRVVLLSASRKF